jgi:simple sugar transport system substrate-binding protein
MSNRVRAVSRVQFPVQSIYYGETMRNNRRALMAMMLAASFAAAMPPSAFAQKKIVLGFSQIGAESEWRTANTNSIKDAAAKEGIDLKFSDAQQKQENQIKALRSFIAQKVDVIAFAPVVESGWDTVLNEIRAAKIPVILTDRSVDSKDTSLYVTFMGSDFTEEGRKAGRWLVEKVKNTKGDVNVVELQGTVGSGPAIDRKKGFEEIIKAEPRIKIIRSQTGDFTRAKGKEVMEAFLKAEGKKINVLYAHNDDMAIGAIQAIEEAGLKPSKDIIIISVDAVKGAFEAMMAGKLDVTVECSPLLGPQLMSAVKDLMAGKTLPRRIVTKEGIFTMDVAAKEFPSRKY